MRSITLPQFPDKITTLKNSLATPYSDLYNQPNGGHMHMNHKTDAPAEPQIAFSDFLKVDIRIGTVIEAEVFKEAKKPAYVLKIDFGSAIGIKKSSAQITELYTCDELIGKKVAAVVNFPPRQIGPLMSEVLTLGFPSPEGYVTLFSPDKPVPNGARLF